MVFSKSFSTMKRSKSFSSLSILPTFRNISIQGILSESWLVANLAVELALILGSRLIWIWMAFRFLLYVALLLIPFTRAGWVFMISDYIKRSIKYGPNPRNYLDIYTASDIMKKSPNTNQSLPGLDRRSSSHRINTANKYPVVVFISGGAWIIGYKCWGAFMGMLLAQLGIVFVAPDYRNFPQGTITDMVTDVTNAVQWTRDNIHKYGGDKDNIYIISQSAGAHIGALMMLLQARKVEIYYKLKTFLMKLTQYRANQKHVNNHAELHLKDTVEKVKDKMMSKEFDSLWDPEKDLKAFVGIAGAYNLSDMKYYLDQRGLYTDIIDKIMEDDLRSASPFYCLYDLFISPRDNLRKLKPLNRIDRIDGGIKNKPFVSMTELHIPEDLEELKDNYMDNHVGDGNMNIESILQSKVELKLPAVYLFHGATDQSVPVSNTKAFSLSLANYGIKTYIKIYPNKSHTAPIIEDPISGKDPLVCDMLRIIYPDQSLENIVHEIEETMTGGLRIPKCVIDFASFVCPF